MGIASTWCTDIHAEETFIYKNKTLEKQTEEGNVIGEPDAPMADREAAWVDAVRHRQQEKLSITVPRWDWGKKGSYRRSQGDQGVESVAGLAGQELEHVGSAGDSNSKGGGNPALP